MLHGDISNKQNMVMGFRVEGTLLHYREKGLKNKVLNSLLGKPQRAEIDKRVLSAIRYVFYKTDYTIALIVQESNYNRDLEYVLDKYNIPYTSVIKVVHNFSDVTDLIERGEISYYIDNREENRGLVNSMYAVDIDQFNTFLRRR